jgi:hypothetical protein
MPESHEREGVMWVTGSKKEKEKSLSTREFKMKHLKFSEIRLFTEYTDAIFFTANTYSRTRM